MAVSGPPAEPPTALRAVEVYDTTLRDGSQAQDVNFTSRDKVAVAERLEAFGMDFIEGGWPGSNPKDVEFFERMKDRPLTRAHLAAFGSTCRKGVPADEDPNLQALIDAHTPVVTIFGKSWTLHVTHALHATLEQNLEMIQSSVAHLKRQGRMVIYDAEHFFDGAAADAEYALATLDAAVAGGADRVVLCDTNGGSLPGAMRAWVQRVLPRVGVPVGIHTHNDGELAVANALAAVEAGCTHVQGTVNGYGERCGNANLIAVIANLVLKMERPQPQNLEELRGLSRFVDERANLVPFERAAYVGDAAFAHKGGVHVSAVNKQPETYEHVAPEAVGNRRRVLLSDLSGRANILAKAAEYGVDLEASDPVNRAVVERIKELEHLGYAFEGAEASFHLLSRKVRGTHVPYFTLHGFTVVIDKRDTDETPRCEATIRVEVDGHVEHTAADGEGPVNALDRALGKALRSFYPTLDELRLTDYKVRVLSGADTGTASVVRVLVEVTDGRETWGTVGASTNLIDASYEALIDAIEYKLVKDGVTPRRAAVAEAS